MKYFLDTEFIESGRTKPIQLLSIGIVAEDGREFYAESAEYDIADCSAWLLENVIPNMLGSCALPLSEIAAKIREFIGDEKPEFWGYYADYDWVVFCQLFGAMIDLPKGWPMYCRDIKQWCDELGNPKLPKQKSGEHNALADARWNRQAWEFLSVKDDARIATLEAEKARLLRALADAEATRDSLAVENGKLQRATEHPGLYSVIHDMRQKPLRDQINTLRDREAALVEALGGILYKSQTGEWYLDANTPSNIDAAGTTYANAKQSAADWREQVEEQATKPLREALESIRDWKSPDGVLQVKDLEWFKALATSDRASEKEGRDG